MNTIKKSLNRYHSKLVKGIEIKGTIASMVCNIINTSAEQAINFFYEISTEKTCV